MEGSVTNKPMGEKRFQCNSAGRESISIGAITRGYVLFCCEPVSYTLLCFQSLLFAGWIPLLLIGDLPQRLKLHLI